MRLSLSSSITVMIDPNYHSLETPESAKLECGPEFENRCTCMRMCYENHHQYVVNCTDSGFRSTAPLAHLPKETQVKRLLHKKIESSYKFNFLFINSNDKYYSKHKFTEI